MKSNMLSMLTAIVVLAVGLVTTTSHVKAYRRNLPPDLVRGEAIMVDPVVFKVVSGEFKGLLADYLLLKAAIIDGGEPEKITEQDWHAIYVLYKQSMALDPRFFTTAYYTQGNLVWREGMATRAIALLEMSAKNRPWDWNPKWYLAFDYINFLDDRERASDYLYKAAKLQGAPPIFAVMAARFKQGQGDTLASIAMLQAMYNQTQNEAFKEVLKKRIEAHTGVYELEQAVTAYQTKYGMLPHSLEDLVTSGILLALPIHPYGKGFVYDSSTGVVDFGIPRK